MGKVQRFHMSYKKPGSGKKYRPRKRAQHVRFRKRYATSLAQYFLSGVWTAVKIGVLIFLAVWGTVKGLEFWRMSPLIRVVTVQWQGDVPSELKTFFPIRPGQNIFQLRPGAAEKACLNAFPELAQFTVRRKWNRTVVARGRYRAPVAILMNDGILCGVDENGFIFPLKGEKGQPGRLPVLEGFSEQGRVREAARSVAQLKRRLPPLYQRLKVVKTDTMNRVEVTIVDGILIYWGGMDPQSVLEKGRRIQKVLDRYVPTSRRATLRFVRENRIVLDPHWREANPT